jgi:hypothetical protein
VATRKEKIKEFWEEKYKSNAIVLSTPSISANEEPSWENKFIAWQKKKAGIQIDINEYTQYCHDLICHD